MKHLRLSSNVYVVLPVFNESRYIAKVLSQLKKYTSRVIVVDDGSKDQTAKIARRYTKHVLQHAVNLGKGAALKTGCEYAFQHLHASAVIFMDGDAQHDPGEIPIFMKRLNAGDKLIFGKRQMGSKMPLIRIFGNQFASYLIRFVFGTYIPDIPSGYKAMTRAIYKKLQWKAQRYDVEMEIAARAALLRIPVTVIPIKTIYHDLDKGMTFLDATRMIFQIVEWKLFL